MKSELLIVLISLIGGGAITFFVTRHFRERKSLGYHIASKMSLVNINREIRDKITIDYKGKRLDNIFSFQVRVINDGNIAIRNQPVLFEFDGQAKILEASYRTWPGREFGEIKRMETVSENQVKFIIPMLNPRDKRELIEFNFLTINNSSNEIHVYARGENMKIHKLPSTFDLILALPLAHFPFYFIFIILVAGIAISLAKLAFPDDPVIIIPILGLGVPIIASVAIILYVARKYRGLEIIDTLKRDIEQPDGGSSV